MATDALEEAITASKTLSTHPTVIPTTTIVLATITAVAPAKGTREKPVTMDTIINMATAVTAIRCTITAGQGIGRMRSTGEIAANTSLLTTNARLKPCPGLRLEVIRGEKLIA